MVATEECRIISIGCNGEWGFEEAVIRALPSCRIDTFDCTGTWPVPEHISDRVTLHKLCMGSVQDTADPQFVTYQGMLDVAHISGRPTFLKMDMEGYEYQSLRTMIHGSSPSLRPAQIALELHFSNWKDSNSRLSWKDRAKDVGEIALFMDFLYKHGNYYLLDRRDNLSCPSCTEILLASNVEQYSGGFSKGEATFQSHQLAARGQHLKQWNGAAYALSDQFNASATQLVFGTESNQGLSMSVRGEAWLTTG